MTKTILWLSIAAIASVLLGSIAVSPVAIAGEDDDDGDDDDDELSELAQRLTDLEARVAALEGGEGPLVISAECDPDGSGSIDGDEFINYLLSFFSPPPPDPIPGEGEVAIGSIEDMVGAPLSNFNLIIDTPDELARLNVLLLEGELPPC